jgi:glutamine synthetase
MADKTMMFKYIVKNVALRNEDGDVHAEADLRRQRLGHAHPHVAVEGGEPLFFDENGYAQLSDLARYYIGGLLKHAPAVLAFSNPTTNSYRRLVPGYEAPVNLVYSQRNRSAACRIPLISKSPKAKRVEFRVPDPSCNPYLAFSAMLMAGLDGIRNKIEPPDPVDKDIYELPREELLNLPGRAGEPRGGARRARGRPRVPARGRGLHRGPHRDLDRLQDGRRGQPGPPAPAPLRVPPVLRHLESPSRRRSRSS